MRQISEVEVVNRISSAVDGMADELVDFLCKIVRIPTENPPGKNYPECAAAIGQKMADAGLTVDYIDVPSELIPKLAPHGGGLPRPSVLGKYVCASDRPVLHFTGHYDVVPAGEGWDVDPYAAVVRDGKIIGRGSSDQKSGIAAQIFAIKALQKAGLDLFGTIVSSATPDEETGGYAGIGYLVDQGVISRNNTDFCIITECLDVDRICLGHRGTMWLELETQGRQCHGCTPFEGVNPIEKMIDLLNAVKAEIMPKLDTVSQHPVMPPSCRKSTFTVTMMNAGIKANMVPPTCRATIDWRLIPEQNVAEAKSALLELCKKLEDRDPSFKCNVKDVMVLNPTIVPDDTEVVKAFQWAGKTVLGQVPQFSISPGSDDQKFVVQTAGIEQCIVYGPGLLTIAHQANEYQPIDALINGAKVMALAAWKLLGKG